MTFCIIIENGSWKILIQLLHFQYVINVKSAGGNHIDIPLQTQKKAPFRNGRNGADDVMINQANVISACGPRCPCLGCSEEP